MIPDLRVGLRLLEKEEERKDIEWKVVLQIQEIFLYAISENRRWMG